VFARFFDCARTHSEMHNDFELTAQCYMNSYGPTSSSAFLGKPLVFAYLEYSEANVEYFRKVRKTSDRWFDDD
jgi:hypothetical protein